VGLEFVYLDCEHGRFGWREFEAMCVVAERHGLTAIARVPDSSAGTIARFLDRGARGIVVPHVETAGDAQRAIDATYYAPIGARSFGAGRPDYGHVSRDYAGYLRESNASISLCLMIESAAAVDNAEEIASLAGVDYLSFGLFDLAQSLGHPGETSHPDVRSAVGRAVDAIHAGGKRVREDFMRFCWINDALVAGARLLLDSVPQPAQPGEKPNGTDPVSAGSESIEAVGIK
jgi:4-hydroxy-2-oxoheptanedioate aldolase